MQCDVRPVGRQGGHSTQLTRGTDAAKQPRTPGGYHGTGGIDSGGQLNPRHDLLEPAASPSRVHLVRFVEAGWTLETIGRRLDEDDIWLELVVVRHSFPSSSGSEQPLKIVRWVGLWAVGRSCPPADAGIAWLSQDRGACAGHSEPLGPASSALEVREGPLRDTESH